MGCTQDVVNINIKNKTNLKIFLDEFNKTLKDELWMDEIDIDDLEIEKSIYKDFIHTYFEAEPMFCEADGMNIIKEFLQYFSLKYPTIHYKVSYFCSYTNCGDVNSCDFSHNNDNEIKIVELYCEQEGIYECKECEEIFDEALVFFDEYDENTEYLCPICGAKNTLNVYKKEYSLILEKDNWIEK